VFAFALLIAVLLFQRRHPRRKYPGKSLKKSSFSAVPVLSFDRQNTYHVDLMTNVGIYALLAMA